MAKDSLMLSIDRFEDDVAVLVTEDDRSFEFPRELLPKDAVEGDILSVAITRDAKATADLKVKTKRIQDDLSNRDPGGDIKL